MNQGNVLILDSFWVDNKSYPTEVEPDSKVGQILYSEYTGTARQLGWMDLIQLKSLIKKRNISHILLKNLDILGRMAEAEGSVKVCYLYLENNHRFLHEVPDKKRNLKRCEPIYRMVGIGGWNFSPDDSDIPFRAEFYMEYLLTQTHVESIVYTTNKVRLTAFFAEHGKVQIEEEQLE